MYRLYPFPDENQTQLYIFAVVSMVTNLFVIAI